MAHSMNQRKGTKMSKYIDVEPFENALMAVQKRSDIISISEVVKTLMKYPIADVQEVKHGRWVNHGSFEVCSVCGEEQYGHDNGRYYCPNCGSCMDLDEVGE